MKRSIWNLLFLISAFGLAFMGAVLIWQEVMPEWAGVQREYNRRLAQVTGDRSKAWSLPSIKQIHLPEMKRTDRCITCHAGIDNPKMADQPQPFKTHPDLGIPGFREKHPFNEIGCTVCHHGQGPAVEKKHAHGPVPHWERPLLSKELIVGTCTTCHQNIGTLKGAERLQKGWALFKEKGCIGCHNLHGKGMLIGPELAEAYSKSSDQFDFKYIQGEETVAHWIQEHFRDPQKVVPGYPKLGVPETPMPDYGLTEEEVQTLTALVISFASEEENEESPVPARFHVPGDRGGTFLAAEEMPRRGGDAADRGGTLLAAGSEPVYASKVEQGAAVFQKAGCVGCHGPQGRGGIRNPNMDQQEVPPLTHVSDGYSKEELKQIIRDGRYPARADRQGLSPPLWMPSWKGKLSEEEIDAVVEYLVSLNPEPST